MFYFGNRNQLSAMKLSPAEIIYLSTKGRITKYLKNIVKYTFYSLLLKNVIKLELKEIKGADIKKEKMFFLQKSTKDRIDNLKISELEKLVFDYLKNSKSEWISLEEFCDKVSALINPRFRAFSKSHRIENYIVKDLIKKGLLVKKPVRLFGFLITEKKIPSNEYVKLQSSLHFFKKENWIIHNCFLFSENKDFFNSNTYKLLNQRIDNYFEQYLLRDGKHIVPAIAIIGKSYPEPLE
ncbi:MAG: hypothetical protein EA412_00685 [Chitinophagaceae bacterium]|nr:MAG: hypothetical protein EA412_00685 [Chitinophagaceae bacterium]